MNTMNTFVLYNKSRYIARPLELHIREISFEHRIAGVSSISIEAVAENHIYPVMNAAPSDSLVPIIQCPALINLISEFYRPGDTLELYDPNSDERRIFRCRWVQIDGREVSFKGEELISVEEGETMNNAVARMQKTVDIDHSFLVPDSVKKIISNKLNCDSIRKVIFNPPATIIIWNDGTKTVVKNSPGDIFDPYFGFIAAYAKHAFGNNSKIKKLLKNKSNIADLKKEE